MGTTPSHTDPTKPALQRHLDSGFCGLHFPTLVATMGITKNMTGIATRLQTNARQVERELHQLYEPYEGLVLQHLNWIFDTTLDTKTMAN